MAETPIDRDEGALAATTELGTSTKEGTVNAALQNIAAGNSRRRAFEHLLELGDREAGELAWRSRKLRARC